MIFFGLTKSSITIKVYFQTKYCPTQKLLATCLLGNPNANLFNTIAIAWSTLIVALQ